MTTLNLNAIIEHLNTDRDTFIFSCLLEGFDFVSAAPRSISCPGIPQPKFSDIIKYVHMETYQSVLAPHIGNSYIENLSRSLALINFQPSLSITNRCVVPPKAPSNMKTLLGLKFPDEIYSLMSVGVIGSSPLNNIIQEVILETPPMVDSQAYHDILDAITELRSKSLALFASCLSSQQNHPFTIVYIKWFEMTKSTLNLNHFFPLLQELNSSVFPEKIISEITPGSSPLSIAACLRIFKSESSQLRPAETLDEAYVLIISQMLQVLE